MRARKTGDARRSFFALTRFWLRLRGRDWSRGEENMFEAYGGGVLVYLVAYVWLVEITGAAFAVAVLILFASWIFLLVLLYLNSLVVVLLKACGIFAGRSNAFAQHLVVSLECSLMALHLLVRANCAAAIGALWLTLVGLNLLAAISLRIFSSPGAPHLQS